MADQRGGGAQEAPGRQQRKRKRGRWDEYVASRCGGRDAAVPVQPHLLSRLLYANPVCVLTTWGDGGARNAMVLTWMTAINNRGLFVASVKQSRHSATLIAATGRFALSVPVRGAEPLLLRVGSCSGRDTDKVAELGLRPCPPGWRRADGDAPDAGGADGGGAWCVEDCVAHMTCTVLSTSEVDGHSVMTCRIDTGAVLSAYWGGKTFAPVDAAEPYLTFFGSQEFGCATPVRATPAPPAGTTDPARK